MTNRKKPPAQVEISRYLGYGLTWALSTLLFLYLGTLADKWLDTKPALTLLGAFVGAAAGFYYMYRHLVEPPKTRTREQDRDE
jgi:F0F1-type ATP synthase assembly protein I